MAVNLRPLMLSISLGVCAASCSTPDETLTALAGSTIVDGTPTSMHREAVFIELGLTEGNYSGSCSGALIAPRVVLTAGHCVSGIKYFQVRAPRTLEKEEVVRETTVSFTEYELLVGRVNPDKHDVAVLILNEPIVLPSYPTLASQPIPDGTDIIAIGRIGPRQSSDLFMSPRLRAIRAVHNPEGTYPNVTEYPFDYFSLKGVEKSDSGGPVEIAGRATREIVAVNSGHMFGLQSLYARVDLVRDVLQTFIEQNGGPGLTSTQCLFKWAEENHSSLLSPAGAADAETDEFEYRYYSNSDTFLGVSKVNEHVYFMGRDRKQIDLGTLADWLQTSNCY